MVNCAVCGQDIQPGTTCLRCETKDRGPSDLTLHYFINLWALLSFLLILAPAFMLVSPLKETMQEAFASVASVRVAAPIALLLTVVFAFFQFSMRDDLHLAHQSRTFREKQRTPLPMRALYAFFAGVVLIFLLGFVVTSKEQLIGSGRIAEGSFPHLLLMFVMTGCLVAMFAFLSLAAGYMAVYDWGLYAEKNTPDPIFLNEQLMLKVVLEAVRKHIDELGQPIDQDNQPVDAGDREEPQLFLTKMQRTPDAGIALLLYEKGIYKPVEEGKDKDKNGDKDKERLIEEKRWLVEADLWARLTKVAALETRTIKVEKPKQES